MTATHGSSENELMFSFYT